MKIMDTDRLEPIRGRKWYEIWWDVWGNPGKAPFQAMLNEPDRGSTRGFIWLGVTTIIVTLINAIGTFLVAKDLKNIFPQGFNYSIFFFVCGLILAPLSPIIGMSIVAFFYHFIVKIFGGNGRWDDLVFCFCAVTAPYTLLAGVLALFTLLFQNIAWVIFVPLVVSVVIGIYMLVLFVNAISAAENIGTWQAMATLFSPLVIFGVCYLLVVLGLMPISGMGN